MAFHIADSALISSRVIGILLCQRCRIEGGIGRCRQGGTHRKSPVMPVYQKVPVDSLGNGPPEFCVLKNGAIGIHTQVYENTVFAVPQLIVTPVFYIPVGTRVRADHTHIIKFKGIADICRRLHAHQRDLFCGDQQIITFAPPVLPTGQGSLPSPACQLVGAGTQRILCLDLVCFYDGNIQQQRQIAIGLAQIDSYFPVFRHADGIDKTQASAVILMISGFLKAGNHILRCYRNAIGKGSSRINGKIIDHQIRAGSIVFAQNRQHFIFPVRGKQTLVHQRKHHPVGEIRSGQRIHGKLRIIGQRKALCFLLLPFRQLTFTLRSQFISHRGVRDGLACCRTAGKQTSQNHKAQQYRNDFFHLHASLHTMMAP